MIELLDSKRAVLIVMTVLLVACGEGEEDTAAAAPADGSNRAPVISGAPPAAVEVGSTYMFEPVVSDPDGDPLVLGVDGKPTWMEFEQSTGRLSGTPGNQHVGMHRGIVLWVSDGDEQTLMPAFDIQVMGESSGGNSAPVIGGSPGSSVVAGSDYAFTPTASDADGDALTFAVQNLPSWASFNPALGRIQGTPSAVNAGLYENIVISVSDGQRGAALSAFDIAVTVPNVNTPPTIAGEPATFVLQGTSYVFQPSATDVDGDTLSFSIANRPSWASFNSTTGRLAGTPGSAHVGVYTNVTIGVSDGTAQAELLPFTINVTASNAPPTISGNPANTVLENVAYVFQPSASDPDGDPLTFTISNRPAWATFNGSTGRLQGTPDAGDVGTYGNIRISATDGAATANLAAFSVTVTEVNDPPTISGTPATTVTQGVQYSFTPSASDPDGDALTFSILSRPTWASFNASTGRLQGTPGAANVGTFGNIRIRVSDGTTTISLAPFSITVAGTNDAPTISGTPASVVLPGSVYSFTPSASDPNGDSLTFSITNRPSWATFNTSTGRLQGTPTVGDVGTYGNVSISVSDGQTSASLPTFSISVNAVALGSATLSWVSPTQNTDGSPLLDLAGFRVYWGTSPGSYNNSVTLNNAGLTTFLVDNLSSGTYYFATSSFNSSGVESSYSNEASKTIP